MQPEGDGEELGSGIESVLEFVLGDEVLKGTSLAEQIGIAGKVTKVLEEHPALAKLVQVGAAALRQGAVGTAQGLAHGATPGQAVEQGGIAGVAGGAAEGAGQVVAGLPLKRGAAALYTRALAPTGKVDKTVAAGVAPELIQKIPFATSLEALRDKAAAYLDQAGAKVRAIEDALPATQTIDLDTTRQALKNFAGKYSVAGDPDAAPTIVAHQSPLLDQHGQPIITHEVVPPAAAVDDTTKFSTAARNGANRISDQLGQIDPTIKNVIAQRRLLDEGLRGVYKGADPELNGNVLAQKTAADILRGQIAAESPKLGNANAEYSFWRKVNDVAQNTLDRRAGQSGGLMHLAAGVAAGGAAVHSLASGASVWGAIEGARFLMQSPASLTLTASAMNAFADAQLEAGTFREQLGSWFRRLDLPSQLHSCAAYSRRGAHRVRTRRRIRTRSWGRRGAAGERPEREG